MKRFLSILVCAAMLAAICVGFSACGKQNNGGSDVNGNTNARGDENGIDGGWTKSDSPEITDEFKTVFEKATETLAGVEYVPVAYLASQVVAGTNHCVLCKATPTVPDAEASYAIVYVYEDLNGGAEITGIVESSAGAEYADADGGWTETASPALTDEAKQALEKACETLAGVEYVPVALLATQVVAGTNYRILCEATATVPNAESNYVIVEAAEAPDGNAEITGTYEFLADENMQIANPLVEYGADVGSLEKAQEAVKFTIAIPESIKPENYIVIDGKLLEIDFDGGYIRKSKGGNDVSGDYNEYETVKTADVDGKEVTFKGNGGKTMLAIWTDGGYTYCVGISDGTSEADITSLVKAIK
ncbi:MAG: hypothetical protein IKX98_03840 [Clostridia bacterium]|nr:hypothetical protein [Clostridia bacterium]